MAIVSKEFPRWVRDPLYAPVKRYLQERLKIIAEQGDLVDRQLAEMRYQGTNPEDFVIESVNTGKDGVKRVCLIRRNRHFARVDLILVPVRLRDVLTELKIPVTPILTLPDFIEGFKKGEVQGKTLYLSWRDSIALCMNNDELLDLAKTNEVLGDIFFKKMTLNRESETTIDIENLDSGLVTIEDDAIGSENIILFVNELVSNELGTNRLEHNFPKVLTEQRGKEVRHLMKITLAGEDITTNASVTFSTATGRVICKTTPNKLESVFSVIRGSSTQVLTEDITVTISYTKDGKTLTSQPKIRFDIQKDTASALLVTATPSVMVVPTGTQVSVVVTCSLNGSAVKPTTIPSRLTSLLGNVTLNIQGEKDGGILYVGWVTTPITVAHVTDILQGFFAYALGTVVHTANCFVETEIVPAIPDYGKLVEQDLTPGVLQGELNATGFFTLEVTKNGDIVPVNELNIPLNTLVGGKQLITFSRTTPTRVYYELVKNSGIKGVQAEDSILLDYAFTDDDGVLWSGRSELEVVVDFPSDVETVPNSPDDIIVERYEQGPLPFKVMIDGVNQTHLYRLMGTRGADGYIRDSLDGISNDKAWMVLGRADNDIVVPTRFTGEIDVNGVVNRIEYVKNFLVKRYDGPAYLSIPANLSVTGKVGDRGEFEFCLYNEDQRFNLDAVYAPSQSGNQDIMQFNPFGERNDQRIKLKYQLVKEGTTQVRIGYTKPGITPALDTCAFVTVDVIAEPADGVVVNVPTAPIWRPFLDNELPLELTYNNVNVPLTDSRVTIDVKFKGYEDYEISYIDIFDDHLVYHVDKDCGFVPENIECTFTVKFIDSDGVTNTKIVDGLVTLVREAFTQLTLTPVDGPLYPIAEQRAHFKLLGDGEPIPGAVFKSLRMKYRDPSLPVLYGYSNILHLVDNSQGLYDFSVTTTHLGGKFYPELVLTVGGTDFTVTNTDDFEAESQPVVTRAVAEGNAILNVKTKLSFSLMQDEYNDPEKPVEMISVTEPVGDVNFVKTVNNLVMVAPGDYTVDVVSTGQEGNTEITFKLTKYELGPTFTKEWDIKVPVIMTRK